MPSTLVCRPPRISLHPPGPQHPRLALKQVFYRLDADGSGTLSREEFRIGLRTLLALQSEDVSDSDLEQVSAGVNVRGTDLRPPGRSCLHCSQLSAKMYPAT